MVRVRWTQWRIVVALSVLGGAMAARQVSAQPSRGALAPGTWAITHVSLVTMTSENVLKDSTIVVRDGRIQAHGPSSSVRAPLGRASLTAAGNTSFLGSPTCTPTSIPTTTLPSLLGPMSLG